MSVTHFYHRCMNSILQKYFQKMWIICENYSKHDTQISFSFPYFPIVMILWFNFRFNSFFYVFKIIWLSWKLLFSYFLRYCFCILYYIVNHITFETLKLKKKLFNFYANFFFCENMFFTFKSAVRLVVHSSGTFIQ
jgi:hypothetical protein